jgi:hypothetical protein
MLEVYHYDEPHICTNRYDIYSAFAGFCSDMGMGFTSPVGAGSLVVLYENSGTGT